MRDRLVRCSVHHRTGFGEGSVGKLKCRKYRSNEKEPLRAGRSWFLKQNLCGSVGYGPNSKLPDSPSGAPAKAVHRSQSTRRVLPRASRLRTLDNKLQFNGARKL